MNISKDVTERALMMLRSLPRVALKNIRDDPLFSKKPRQRDRGQHGGDRHGAPQKGSKQRQNYMRVGYETGNTPFFVRFSREHYYKGHHLKREYPPLTLLELQKIIDMSRIETNQVIDLGSLVRSGIYRLNPNQRQFGVNLTEEGVNKFKACIDIEVQWCSEAVIAAIERLGGSVTMAYYDIHSLHAIKDPERYFRSGHPIPRRMIPPEDAIEAYTDPEKRGYLADPALIEQARGVLAQKYGYPLVQRAPPPKKDPRQVFWGLQPGWIVNLSNKTILKPKDPELLKLYSS